MKGQAGGVLTLVMIIIITGVMLSLFGPTIESFRVQILSSLTTDPNPNVWIMKVLLYSFNPLMWIMYVFLSGFILIRYTRGQSS